MEVKECSSCKLEKSLDSFDKQKTGKFGVRSKCKYCRKRERDENKESIALQNQKYYQKNKKEIRSKHKIYYQNNKLAFSENNKKWRKENPEKFQQYRKKWRDKNPHYHSDYEKERRINDLDFKLRGVLRSRLFKATRNICKKGSAVQDLGCTIPELMSYLESKFQPGMTWDNYGSWHIDHIKPLSKFDLTKAEDLKVACHFSNLQPLWAIDNLKKGNR